jgi:hypothetical protein
MCLTFFQVPDLHHYNADSDPAFHLNSYLDPDLDPALHQSMGICDPWSLDPPGLYFCRLQASIASVRGPPKIQRFIEPPKLRNCDFNADPDLAFHSNADPELAWKKNADPVRNHSFFFSIP